MIYLGPYEWNEGWNRPSGTRRSIDLRNQSQMSSTVQDGVGLFEADQLDSNYEPLGNPDDKIDSRIKSAYKSLTGYDPEGDTVVDLVFDHLTMGADPTGAAAPKPLNPDPNLRIPWKAKQFRIGHSKEENRVLSLLRENYTKLKLFGTDIHRKYLGAFVLKYGVPASVLTSDDTPVAPTTLLSETFNGIDQAQLGHDLSWTEGGTGTDWDNFNNHGRKIGTNNNFNQIVAHPGVFSTDDLSSAGDLISGIDSGSRMGVSSRLATDLTTYYYFHMRNVSGGTAQFELFKVVSNVQTELDSAMLEATLPGIIKLEVIGSSLKGLYDSVAKLSATDTAITGNVRCGLFAFNQAGFTNAVEYDNWEGEDILTFSDGQNGAAVLLGMM